MRLTDEDYRKVKRVMDLYREMTPEQRKLVYSLTYGWKLSWKYLGDLPIEGTETPTTPTSESTCARDV